MPRRERRPPGDDDEIEAALDEDAATHELSPAVQRALDDAFVAELAELRVRTGVDVVRGALTSRPMTLVIGAAAGMAASWLCNVAMLAVKYDGYVVPPGVAASGQGNRFWGGVFWFGVSALVAAIAAIVVVAGPGRAVQLVVETPATLRSLLRSDDALVPGLWGFAGTALIATIVTPAVSGVAMLTSVVVLSTAARPIVAGVVQLAWRRLLGGLSRRATSPSVTTVSVAALGSMVAFGAGYVVANELLLVLLGVVAAIAALAIARRPAPEPTAAAALVVVAAAAIAVLLQAAPARADDGGWRECGSTFGGWVGCAGSDKLMEESVLAALAGLLGGGVGALAGAGIGALEGGKGPGGEGGEGEGGRGPGPLDFWDSKAKNDRTKKYAKEWRAAGGEPTDPDFERFVHERERQDHQRFLVEMWRREHPGEDPTKVFNTSFDIAGSGSGGVDDVSVAVIDSATLAKQFGVGAVRLGWKVGTKGVNAVVDVVKSVPRSLADTRRTDEWLQALKAAKAEGASVVQANRAADKAIIEKYGEAGLESLLRTSKNPDATLRDLAASAQNGVLEKWVTKMDRVVLDYLAKNPQIREAWHVEKVTNIASGADKTYLWLVEGSKPAEMKNIAEMFLKNHGQFLPSPPTAEQLVKTWQAALAKGPVGLPGR